MTYDQAVRFLGGFAVVEISGFVAPGFEGVRDAFEQNFVVHGDVGAGVSVVRHGVEVVHLVGGFADANKTLPYTDDTLQLVFSTTKGAAAMCAHLLAQRGELDLDAPVVTYWPEFGAKGKHDIPVRWLLSHKSGLVDVDASIHPDDGLSWELIIEAIEGSEPLWEPGTQHGYHAVTYGWLVGELVKRVSGKTLGTFFHEEFATPLGLDFWIGLPPEQDHRVSPIIAFTPPQAFIDAGISDATDMDTSGSGLIKALSAIFGPDNMIARALTAPGGAFKDQNRWNEPEVWHSEIPSANGITNASSLAGLYAACVSEVDGVRILNADTIKAATHPQTEGGDAVLVIDIPFASGFMLDGVFSKLGGPGSFGHYGFGGSVGFGDQDNALGFGYVMNQSQLAIAGDPRTAGLIDAVYAAL